MRKPLKYLHRFAKGFVAFASLLIPVGLFASSPPALLDTNNAAVGTVISARTGSHSRLDADARCSELPWVWIRLVAPLSLFMLIKSNNRRHGGAAQAETNGGRWGE